MSLYKLKLNNTNNLDLPAIPIVRHNYINLFKFPGSFHPPLVNQLIRMNDDATRIGDPMAGSGTLAVEGVSLGKDVYNMDIDPVSCLITSTLSNPIDYTNLEDIISQWIENAKPFPLPNQVNRKTAINTVDELIKSSNYKPPKNMFHWFEPYIVFSLSKLLLSLDELEVNQLEKNVLNTILASIIRRVSNADLTPVSGLEVTKIMRKRIAQGLRYNIINEIKSKSNFLIEGYKELFSYEKIGKSQTIQGNCLNGDWCDFISSHGIELDLVITSPPYCNAIEYWRRHRLEYFWLGFMDNNKIRDYSRNFIGSTTVLKSTLDKIDEPNSKQAKNIINQLKNKGKNKKSLLLQKYFKDVEILLPDIMNSLTDNGILYLIVGPSTSYGVEINTPGIISEIIENLGYKIQNTKEYYIKNRRMQYPTKNHNKIKTETILEIIKDF